MKTQTKTRLVEADLQLPLSVEAQIENVYNEWHLGAAQMLDDVWKRVEEAVKLHTVKYARLDSFAPTTAQALAYQRLFEFFNQNLFGGVLPNVVLNFSRKQKSLGFFRPSSWGDRVEVAMNGAAAAGLHEISLNPDWLWQDVEETLSTLVHEMCHLKRHITGIPPRGGYHDMEWANMMLEVGLTPVSYDNPGKMTGQKVSHKIEQKGEFMAAFLAMPSEYLFPFSHALFTEKKSKTKNQNKVKYTCPGCEMSLWGKSGLSVACGECSEDGEMQLLNEAPAKD